MNRIRVIVKSEKIGTATFHDLSSWMNLYQLNEFVNSNLVIKPNKFNKYLSKLACCFIKMDYEKHWLLLRHESFPEYAGVKLTDQIGKYAKDGTLICVLDEVSEYEYKNFENKYTNDCKPPPPGLTDINLNDNVDSSSDDESIEASYFGDEFGGDFTNFKSSTRYFSWGVKKKKVKSHYYSWN